jgi:dTDP-4-dehydrorhamnose 3,5-epimerase-like enzyme
MDKPRLISFKKIGESSLGFISVAESATNIPFVIERTFWTYYTPEEVVRGRHAHHHTEMILIAIGGRIVVNTEMPDGSLDVFVLDKPNEGLYLPKLCWHTMQYSHSVVQLVLASSHYSESDYIRSYEEFKKISA